MTAKNARVWDADNQERPEKPNATSFGPHANPNIAYLTAMNALEEVWSKVHASEPPKSFNLRVELQDGQAWDFTVLVEWVPELCVQEARKVEAAEAKEPVTGGILK